LPCKIAGVLHLPPGAAGGRWGELPHGFKVVTYCTLPLDGGLQAWLDAGLPADPRPVETVEGANTEAAAGGVAPRLGVRPGQSAST
jgi:hypothetical protein